MIIEEIKHNHLLFFKKEELILKTDEGKSIIKTNITKEKAKELDTKLKGREVNSLEDLSIIKEETEKIEQELTEEIQLAIINSSTKGWTAINKNAKQVPRPVYSLLKKERGIKEFFLLSLNAKNFDTLLQSCSQVKEKINKTPNINTKTEEEILTIIKEAIDEIYKDLDFEIRIGALFDNYSNGKYIYQDKNLNEEEQKKFIEKLIDNYDLLYIENPFFENSEEIYTKFTEVHKEICLISIKSRINDYTKAINEKMCNTVVYSYTTLEDFKINIPNIRDTRLNIIMDGDAKLINLMVGFGVPMIKLDDTNSSEISKQIGTAAVSIQNFVNKK